MRLLPAFTALTFAIACVLAPARAQDSRLPDIGSSAAEMIDPATEAEYASYVLYELRRMNLVLDDPLVESWLQTMGYRLAASSNTPRQSFTFFMLREREINAFATLGGLVGMNSGLVLTAESEAEVAGVLAHEVAHVSQRHVLRAVERAKKDQIPILLAMVGAIAAAQAASDGEIRGGRRDDSASNATAAAITGAMALMQQRQIDYTRSNESEADRIGIQTLARAGYDPAGMADFFERMQRAQRSNMGGYVLPEYLRTHPVTTTRISEARQRAGQLGAGPAHTGAPRGPANPLLPGDLRFDGGIRGTGDSPEFRWVRDRLRVLSAGSPTAALREYRELAAADHTGRATTDGERYGMALAQMRAGQPGAALEALQALLRTYPDDLWLQLAEAEATALAGPPAAADRLYEALMRRLPENRAVRLSYAQTLVERGGTEAGRRAQEVLRPLIADSARDPTFQRGYARASELAGDLVRAGEAYAETAYLNGRAVDALNQLAALKDREDLSYYQRARIEARIAAITPVVLEMQRQGIEAHEQRPDGP
ncbi:M48 family metalloprotease [Arenimonas composti]|uniref:Putative beta-barrel assembly-enhancing protease n=1 Tax=Arenimonas composti TR7-09 = DSM 18010 TaxID=1121013 RepID=A0A091BFJ2_9GAMM|nr:M48 family metalloprotease [Arenimonas composti]KFN50491.1 hypothetical protein P873_07455 [Arenimonas composti TR7-09 = DSM 18010]